MEMSHPSAIPNVTSYRLSPLTAEKLTELRRPFAPEAIKFRLGGGGVLPYIDARVVIERLNKVCPGWSTRFEILPTGKQIVCHLTIGGVTRSDVGTMGGGGGNVDPVKAGYSDALKRAAVHFGVGVSVYALKRINESDLPNGAIKTFTGKDKKEHKYLTADGGTALRKGYRNWLKSDAGKHFGEVLSHGDIAGSVGDPEAQATPGEAEQLEIDPPHDWDAILSEITGLYEALDPSQRPNFGPGKFKANLKSATAEGVEALEALKAKVKGMGA